ncbi:MAG: hypothetical protein R3B54_00830 [Bdellovibrionota bacterium]
MEKKSYRWIVGVVGLVFLSLSGRANALSFDLRVSDAWGDENNRGSETMVRLDDYIYVGLRNRETGAKIYRFRFSDAPSELNKPVNRNSDRTMENVTPPNRAFSSTTPAGDRNADIRRLVVYQKRVCAATDRAEVWCFDPAVGVRRGWTKVSPDWDYSPSSGITDMAVVSRTLYVALGDPIRIKAYYNNEWSDAMNRSGGDGFGRHRDAGYSARLMEFKGNLLMATGRRNPGGDGTLDTAPQVWLYAGFWRNMTPEFTTDFVNNPDLRGGIMSRSAGFGDRKNGAIISMKEFKSAKNRPKDAYVYFGTHNGQGHAQIWRGIWKDDRKEFIGFQNVTPSQSFVPNKTVHAHTMEVHLNQLYVGTRDGNGGARIWATAAVRGADTPIFAEVTKANGARGQLDENTDLVSVLFSASYNVLYAGTWNRGAPFYLYRTYILP